jgi:transposase
MNDRELVEITRRGGLRPCLRIVRLLFAALSDPAGVLAHRTGALERVQLLLQDWRHSRLRLADTESRMTAVLDELNLTELATSITGLSALGAAGRPWCRPDDRATLCSFRPPTPASRVA